jgi:hypothetical protein
MSQLNKIMDRPEAVQLYQSMINYMLTKDFDPQYNLKPEELGNLFLPL